MTSLHHKAMRKFYAEMTSYWVNDVKRDTSRHIPLWNRMLNADSMFRKIMLSFKNKLTKRVKGLVVRTICHRMMTACTSSNTLSSNSITAHLRKDHLSMELLIADG
jgi:hypothetical protein